jgi:hypothetical protein
MWPAMDAAVRDELGAGVELGARLGRGVAHPVRSKHRMPGQQRRGSAHRDNGRSPIDREPSIPGKSFGLARSLRNLVIAAFKSS